MCLTKATMMSGRISVGALTIVYSMTLESEFLIVIPTTSNQKPLGRGSY